MIIGVIGGGQLARMLAMAGHPWAHRFVFLDPAPDACAGPLGELITAPYDCERALLQLAEQTDVVTFDFENVPARSLEFLAGRVPVYPGARALGVAQDRLHEKALFHELGMATADFVAVAGAAALPRAVAELGLPAVLKTRTQGYDGKGQWLLRGPEDVAAAGRALGDQLALLEKLVPFDREVSLIAVRGRDGAVACYPLSENTHRDGMLHTTVCRPGDALQAVAEAQTHRLLDALDYVGVLAVEFFQVGTELLANEFAPRVHNSGHWTIEGAETSQFENHLRAILGLPLGSTRARGAHAMLNLIGAMPDAARVLAISGAHLHDYGKEPRPGRKVGHITIACPEQGLALPLELLAL
ncbi:MAG: 5-(carboxyamino)imidazole ribonucleotide synthase [Gammaproteobacteria bacterium]|nr:5-(carboxyamino)imidazole ribonucleotide synthase [Gammaproteobacteria bacterium]